MGGVSTAMAAAAAAMATNGNDMAWAAGSIGGGSSSGSGNSSMARAIGDGGGGIGIGTAGATGNVGGSGSDGGGRSCSRAADPVQAVGGGPSLGAADGQDYLVPDDDDLPMAVGAKRARGTREAGSAKTKMTCNQKDAERRQLTAEITGDLVDWGAAPGCDYALV